VGTKLSLLQFFRRALQRAPNRADAQLSADARPLPVELMEDIAVIVRVCCWAPSIAVDPVTFARVVVRVKFGGSWLRVLGDAIDEVKELPLLEHQFQI